ncbi:hypothetical protein M427DRAFT_74813 [Gonapodya prolifera JEL478]|uniref:Transcriptional adapter 2 n=1 Tax=Gonapodya prolifera (strain JEL478) TaxID=1344416 RepID=A0A138ZZH2_GONPJ|nr:hypothetical protein M427DRAFT_74813 [Gonapodya prolifera JEL478]|eukprot:KXS09906.1 hypothetical protein M427DRAFT_74813 [Gonapodya prolifera JEL478]
MTGPEALTASPRKSQVRADVLDGPEDPDSRYNCDDCSQDITDVVRITCASCDDVDLCVSCFAKGSEPATRPDHRNDHPYRVIEVLDFPVFDPLWSANEELLLIENLEHCGLGNWEQVSRQMCTKTKEECLKHYEEVYINSSSWPIPDMLIEFRKEANRRRIKRKAMEVTLSTPSKKKATQSIKTLESNPGQVHEIRGYMPGRGEYDIEPENSAEDIVKDITFDVEDGPGAVLGLPTDEDLKLAILDVYNEKLNIREDQKRLVKGMGLLEYGKLTNLERQRKAEERAVYNRAKVFARCISKTDFEEWMQGFYEELDLRRQIAQLQEWRRMGVRTAEEGEQYESHKVERADNIHALRLRLNVGPLKNSIATSAAMDLLERNFGPGTGVKVAKESTPRFIGSGVNLISPPTTDDNIPVNKQLTPPSTSVSNISVTILRIIAPTAPASTLRQPRFTRPSTTSLDITKADGVELLSPPEQLLCSTLRLPPGPYLIIREKCIKESVKLGGIRRMQMRDFIKIDVNKAGPIYDAFLEWGWIRKPEGNSHHAPGPTATLEPNTLPPNLQIVPSAAESAAYPPHMLYYYP